MIIYLNEVISTRAKKSKIFQLRISMQTRYRNDLVFTVQFVAIFHWFAIFLNSLEKNLYRIAICSYRRRHTQVLNLFPQKMVPNRSRWALFGSTILLLCLATVFFEIFSSIKSWHGNLATNATEFM